MKNHYFKTWEAKPCIDKWPADRIKHSKAIHKFAAQLNRYGYHGYGNPDDDNGVLVFDPSRIKVLKVLLDIPSEQFKERSNIFDQNLNLKPGATLKQL